MTPQFIDRDELGKSLAGMARCGVETGNDAAVRHINACILILDAMPVPSCETCGHKGAKAYLNTPNQTCSCNLDARWNALSYACSEWTAKEEG